MVGGRPEALPEVLGRLRIVIAVANVDDVPVGLAAIRRDAEELEPLVGRDLA